MENSKKSVLVTGFGPFGIHSTNASWEAVQELVKLSKTSNFTQNYEIIHLEIPVSYEDVSTIIPKLWETYEPVFVIHVGVSAKAKCLIIESRAHKIGYCGEDVYCKLPEADQTVDQKILAPTINVDEVCQVVNNNCEKSGCKAMISDNAGRYLCEYLFFQSLSIDPEKVLFIHVPDFCVYSTKQCALGIHDILQHLLETNKEKS